MRWLAVLVLAFTLVAAGCGGSDESSAPVETTTEETTTDETTTEETTTEETGTTDLSGVLGDEDCLALASVGASFAQAVTGATDEEAAAALQKLADEVPDEIKADVQVLADWFAEYTAKLKDIGIEAGQTPTADQLQQLQAALAATNQEELTAASQRLEAWTQENCTG
jgi:Xaa-Pro aminopeptidase